MSDSCDRCRVIGPGTFPPDDPDGSKARVELEKFLMEKTGKEVVSNGMPGHRILNTSNLARKLFPVQELPAGAFAVYSKGEKMNEERITVGLDMSLTGTGFCIKQGSKITVETIKTDTKTCVDDLARLKHIVGEVMKRIPQGTAMICIEDFFTPANAFQIGSAIKLAMLGAAIRLALYDAKHPFYIIAPSQVKKYVTGSGAAQKSIIVREVFKRYGLEVKDDNQADACAMAHLADSVCFLPEDAPKYQVEVVKKVINERPCYNIPGKPPRDAE